VTDNRVDGRAQFVAVRELVEGDAGVEDEVSDAFGFRFQSPAPIRDAFRSEARWLEVRGSDKTTGLYVLDGETYCRPWNGRPVGTMRRAQPDVDCQSPGPGTELW